jgi:hypothetical protein
MITIKRFLIYIFIIIAVSIGICFLYQHRCNEQIDLVKNELKSSDMQIGIWQTEYETIKVERDKLQIENEQLYGAIEANTLILDYTTGLVYSYKIYTKELQLIMSNNNMIYPEFIYKTND